MGEGQGVEYRWGEAVVGWDMEGAGDSRLYNQRAEEAMVGSFFLDNSLVKECSIRPDQLYLSKLQGLLAVILRLDDKGIPIDIISVIEEAGVQNLENFGGVSYISSLAVSVPSVAHFHAYQQTVKEYHQRRKAVEIAGRIRSGAQEGDIIDVLREGIQDLMMVDDLQNNDDRGEIEPGLVEIYTDCETDQGDISGIPSGFFRLDRLTGGFQESDLIVIGARPSVGKTAFALNIALHAAQQDVALVFSLEMSQKQLLKRAASYTGDISSTKMRNPRRFFEDADWTKFNVAMGILSILNLRIFDKAGMDLNFIWSKVRKMRHEYGAEKRILVVVDYLQLIAGDRKHASNRQAEISEISRTLKHMARELNVVIIALSQLSRGVESRQDKRPMLSDLRESGQIEQDADVIAFLYRDDYYDKHSGEKDKIEIILAKQRNGPIGTVKLGFEKECGRFRDK